jgi:hypothetical protein
LASKKKIPQPFQSVNSITNLFALKKTLNIIRVNLKWNYYASMTEHEIEESRAFDARWERPTNPFGKGEKRFKPAFIDPMGAIFSTHTSADFQSCPFPAHSEEMKALNLFQLSYPLKRETLKIRYKELVKKFHPDVNQGSSEAETTLKKITHAYSILKKIL